MNYWIAAINDFLSSVSCSIPDEEIYWLTIMAFFTI